MAMVPPIDPMRRNVKVTKTTVATPPVKAAWFKPIPAAPSPSVKLPRDSALTPWTYVRVKAPINFQFSSDTKKFHNGIVKNCTVYCRKTDMVMKGETAYLLLYQRPKRYWVGHLMVPSGGKTSLETVRDAISGKPHEVIDGGLIMTLDEIYDMFMEHPSTYDNMSHKTR